MISLPKSKQIHRALLIISADVLVDFQGSGISEKTNLNSSNVSTSWQENLTGSYQCTDCDETLCVKCFKAHSS